MALKENALTTVAEVKAELGLTGTEFDTYLERQINVVSEKIANYCNRNFGKADYTDQQYKGNDTLYLLLNEYPILEVSRLKIDDYEQDITDLQVFSEEGKIYLPKGFWKSGLVGGVSKYNTNDIEYNIEVTYEAGYVLPMDDGTPDNRTLPYDLEQACIDEVVHAYENKGTSRQLESWSLDKASKKFSTIDKTTDMHTGFLISTKMLLDGSYKRWIL